MPRKQNENKPVYDVNWYDDKYQSVVVFRNWLLIITFLALVGILLMTLASYYFVPLKSVSPFVVQIDEKSGITQVVNTKSASEYTSNDALIKSFAMKYVHAREDYDYRMLQTSDELVRLMSTGEIYRGYRDQIYNKQYGYYNVFGAMVTRTVQPISIQLNLNRTTGESTLVTRLSVRELSAAKRPQDYTITVTMVCFFDPKFTLSDDERLVNPLGFRVVNYNAVKETLPNANTQQ